MQQFILVLHVLGSLALIALVLLQHGKGADIGANFGSGASNTMFGSQGALPFLVKITTLLAAVFFATSLSLSYITAKVTTPANALVLPGLSQMAQPPTTTPTQPSAPTNQ